MPGSCQDDVPMRLPQISEFLHVPEDEALRLIQKENLPAHKIGGAWRFRRDEVLRWLAERHLPGISRERWRQIEHGRAKRTATDPTRALVGPLIPKRGIALDMPAKTRASALRELVAVAEDTGLVYDAQGITEAIITREKLSPTAMAGGVAFPHPYEPQPYAVEGSLVVVGVTARPVPFGAPDGGLTDVFFLVVAIDGSTHLHVLARLSRMLAEGDLADELRSAGTCEEARDTIEEIELCLAAGLAI